MDRKYKKIICQYCQFCQFRGSLISPPIKQIEQWKLTKLTKLTVQIFMIRRKPEEEIAASKTIRLWLAGGLRGTFEMLNQISIPTRK